MQRPNGAAARLGRVGFFALPMRGPQAEPAQYREHSRQACHVRRQDLLELGTAEVAEELAERVDEPIQALIGDRLVLEAAAAQDCRLAATGDALEEAVGERALAHAGAAGNDGERRPAVLCG